MQKIKPEVWNSQFVLYNVYKKNEFRFPGLVGGTF